MPAWGNTDAFANTKPKFGSERQTREIKQLTTANSTSAGATVIFFTYTDGGANNVANIGIASGQYVYAANLAANGTAGFFKSNNNVASISANTVTFTNAAFGTIPAGSIIEFDTTITFNNPVTANQYSDTVLITASRAVNANSTIANTGNFNAGWVHIYKKVNNDGTVRLIKETLVCLANASAVNVSSSNTSFGNMATGL